MHTYFDVLRADITVLTSTRRLARTLKRSYDDLHQSKGLLAWDSPDILPWPAWLNRCWDDCVLSFEKADRVKPLSLINSQQELALWEQVISSSTHGDGLLQIGATANSARDAWTLLNEWGLSLKTCKGSKDINTTAFFEWANSYTKLLDDNNLVDSAQLPGSISKMFKNGGIEAPKKVALAGFDEIKPQQNNLLDILRELGAEVVFADQEGGSSDPKRIELINVQEEITIAARWTRKILEDNPSSKVGIVIPDLNSCRDTADRIFGSILTPESILPGHSTNNRIYNISLGIPLIEYPIIHTAFLILESTLGPLTLESMGSLVRSPFLAGADIEMTRRAMLDAQVRDNGETHVFLEDVSSISSDMYKADRPYPYSCPILSKRLDQQLKEIDKFGDFNSPSSWTTIFERLLHNLGWPGDRSLSSGEFQTVQKLRELYSNLASCDSILGHINYKDALARLKSMAETTLFQPETPETPIQILGIIETSGMQFDHLWVVGLHAEQFPSRSSPNPFLPNKVQREHGLPHSSPNRELEFWTTTIERLKLCAPEIIMSNPTLDGDRYLRPSPLIKSYKTINIGDLDLAVVDDLKMLVYKSASFESLVDSKGPPVPCEPRVRGGTRILKLQASCPFSAFAELRLGAKPLGTGTPGLDPMQRGSMMHSAMESLWLKLENHNNLTNLPEGELSNIVSESVLEATKELTEVSPRKSINKFRKLEHSRMTSLILDWLMIEKERNPFTVACIEEKRLVDIGGIEITVKIDRIDELDSGGFAVIDYKTGQTNVAQWFGDRPDEPQLPLYCLSGDEEVMAVLFAQMKPGKLGFKGLSRREDVIPGVKSLLESRDKEEIPSWDFLLEHWKDTLAEIAEGYRSGNALVDPNKYPASCKYCDLTPLCRVNKADA